MSLLLRFQPLFMERVWGGRRLAERYGKQLPAGVPIGESWELVDRPEQQSVVLDGPLAGRTLGELWRGERRVELFGARAERWGERFPLLVKLLDAEHVLSVQVHPPASVAPEPKTEMWLVLDARPGAYLLAGLRAGVDRAQFEAALRGSADAAALLHRIDVVRGDAILIPSGRVHAIGPGNVIVEIQQNSDTTYRVYDFARTGLDGVPRELHVDEALASIDFDDAEPSLEDSRDGTVVACEYFEAERFRVDARPRTAAPAGEMAILTALAGRWRCGDSEFSPGQFALVPAADAGATLTGDGELLRVTLPR